ncbi:MAG: acyl carrier protein [Clostridia bacterium]|nr:acyl carrier protein [Clostridia bacterium]
MVFETIQRILAEQIDVDAADITMDALLLEDLGVDSIDVVDLVMSIEDEFGVEVPEDGLDGVKTVGDAVKVIESLVG